MFVQLFVLFFPELLLLLWTLRGRTQQDSSALRYVLYHEKQSSVWGPIGGHRSLFYSCELMIFTLKVAF